jgi:hypothetical protein
MAEGRVLGILFLAVGVLGVVVAVSSRPLYRVEPRRPNPVLLGVLLGGGMTAFVILLFLFGR